MTEPSASAPVRRRWPFGLLVVAGLRAIDAAVLVAVALEYRDPLIPGLPVFGSNIELTRVADASLAILTLVGIVGLLLFKRWGWVLTMVLVGLSLLLDLVRVATGEPGYLSLLLHVATAFYLNGRSVRALAAGELKPEPGSQP